MTDICEWNFRVDRQYWDQAQEYLSTRPHLKYYACLEKATNWHYQGVLNATRTQKENLSKAIVQNKGHTNGKQFAHEPDKYTNAYSYCSKGIGKFGCPGTPPEDVRQNMGLDPVALHKEWWNTHAKPIAPINIYNISGGKKRKAASMFSKLIGDAEDAGYHYHDSGLEEGEERKSMDCYEASKIVGKRIRTTEKSFGFNRSQIFVEDLVMRFCTPMKNVEIVHSRAKRASQNLF